MPDRHRVPVIVSTKKFHNFSSVNRPVAHSENYAVFMRSHLVAQHLAQLKNYARMLSRLASEQLRSFFQKTLAVD